MTRRLPNLYKKSVLFTSESDQVSRVSFVQAAREVFLVYNRPLRDDA